MELAEPHPEITLPMERPLFTPPLKPVIDNLCQQYGDEQIDDQALFSQVVVDKKRLAGRLGKTARGEQFESGRPRTVAELYTALRTHTENNLRPGSRKLRGLDWRWEHLMPVFAHLRADLVTSSRIESYKKQRRSEGAALATVQRELAALRRMFRYGLQTGTVHNVPHFGLVKENNVRRG